MIFRRTLLLWIFGLWMFLTPALQAQKNEIGITAGGYFPVNTPLAVVPAAVIQGSYARRLLSVPLLGIYAEIPIARTFDVGLNPTNASFNALFIVPGVKAKIAPSFPISPWLALGYGLAHFSAGGTFRSVGLSGSSNSGVADFGGGIDLKIAPYVSLRGEARDYFTSGLSDLIPVSIPGFTGTQHNVITSAGIVVRF